MKVTPHFAVENEMPPMSVCVDLDGTLATATCGDDGLPLAVRNEMARLLYTMHCSGWHVVVWSARPVSHNHRVRGWLRTHGLNSLVDEVACGTKPPADLFIDDRGLLPPMEALRAHVDLLAAELNDAEEPVEAFVADFTKGPVAAFLREMWEVPENADPNAMGYRDDDRYRCIIPVSGGLDSTTAYRMAHRAGLPIETVYVSWGAEYEDAERWALGNLGIPIDHNLKLEPAQRGRRFGHIDVARNARIIWTIAELADSHGWWGDIWFGDNAGFTEGSIRGGDKSHRFFLTINQLLTIRRYDVQVQHPVGGMTKYDMVRWLGTVPGDVTATFSCFNPTGGVDGADEWWTRCGSCGSCFRWATALLAGNYPITIDDPSIWTNDRPSWSRKALGPWLLSHDKLPDTVTYTTTRRSEEMRVLVLLRPYLTD